MQNCHALGGGVYFVNDAVVTDPNTPTLTPRKLFAPAQARLVSQGKKGNLDAFILPLEKACMFFLSTAQDGNFIQSTRLTAAFNL